MFWKFLVVLFQIGDINIFKIIIPAWFIILQGYSDHWSCAIYLLVLEVKDRY